MNPSKRALPPSSAPSSWVPGGLLLHSSVFLAAALMAFNAFYLRPTHPGWWSGKLSDVAVNYLFPVFLAAALEWLQTLWLVVRGRPPRPLGWAWRLGACIFAAAYFSVLQLWPGFEEWHHDVLYSLDALFGSQRRFVKNYPDLSDLPTLFTTVLAAFYLKAKLRRDESTVPLR